MMDNSLNAKNTICFQLDIRTSVTVFHRNILSNEVNMEKISWDNDIIHKQALVVDVKNIDEEKSIPEILRMAISAEFEAITLYENLEGKFDDINMKNIFDEIINDEKKHVGQFEELLLQNDNQQNMDMDKGKQENKEILG